MEENEFNYINVIPLVDVMLVLLTIVLTTSTFIASGAISVSLPKASPQQAQAAKSQIISINSQGIIYFAAKMVSFEDLNALIKDIDRETSIILRADQSIRLQVFVDVLDLLNNKGFKKVAIQTQRKDQVKEL
ncbi:MAG: biopolymer transporter ExbD [Smithella sp. SDB]|nr:MAG: biopolymer transporter ExbD [Smithella sp. SDB]